MRCAVVNIGSGLVENLIVADAALDAAPEGYLLIDAPDQLAIGDRWDGAAFIFSTVPAQIAAPPPTNSPETIDGLETL